MRSISLSADQRAWLYVHERTLWRLVLSMMPKSKRLEVPRGEVTLRGPADIIDRIAGVLGV